MKQFRLKDIDKVLIVAELSANHNGSLDIAIETIKAAKKAGADAIKIQTYKPDTITLNSDREDFLIKGDGLWAGEKLYDLYKKAFTPWEWHEELYKVARDEGLICFSSPFDKSSVDFLEKLYNPIYKIASFEITDIPLIKYVASKNKPVIISTGIAKIEDIELALEACYSENNNDLALLKCTSGYPAPVDEINLKMISDFADRFGIVPGLSDHTLGIIAPIISVSQGAKIIEKHFILDKNMGGPDSSFSLDPVEFSQMVKSVRIAEKMLGNVSYELTNSQVDARKYCRSLYVSQDIKKGDIVTEENIKSVRPGNGLHPIYFDKILGKQFVEDLKIGEPLSLIHIK